MTKITKAEREAQLQNLRNCFPKGSIVYTTVRRVSSSGMSRNISVISLAVGENEIVVRHPNYATATVLNLPFKKGFNDSVQIKGCGMDMGYEIAHRIASALYDDGYALKHQWL